MKWFRLYDDILDDPKLFGLSDSEFRCFINLLCLANKRSRDTQGQVKRGSIDVQGSNLLMLLRCHHKTLESTTRKLTNLSIISNNGNGIEFINWNKRQYKSDDVYSRVKRFRNVSETVNETPPDNRVQNTDTEKDKRNTKEKLFITPLIGEFENVKLTEIQLGKLKEQFGENDANRRIEALSMYLASKGKKYKDHYATILTWARKEGWRGNKTDGGVNDNLFLRTIREENERAASGRLGGRSRPVSGSGNSEGGPQGYGGVPKDADTFGRNSENTNKPNG